MKKFLLTFLFLIPALGKADGIVTANQGLPGSVTKPWPVTQIGPGGGGGSSNVTLSGNTLPATSPVPVTNMGPFGAATATPNATQIPLMIATQQIILNGIETAVISQQTAVAVQQTQQAAIMVALATMTPVVNQASFAITLNGATPVTEILPNMSFNTMSINMWTGSGVTIFQAYVSGGVTTAGSTAIPFWDSQNRILQTTVLTNLKDTFFSSITGFQGVILDPNGSNTAIVYFSYGITDSAANHFANAFSSYATAQPTVNPTQGPLMLATVQAQLNLQLTPIVAQATVLAAYATAIAQPTPTNTPNTTANNYPRVSELAIETAVSAQLTAVAAQGTPISPAQQATAVAAQATNVSAQLTVVAGQTPGGGSAFPTATPTPNLVAFTDTIYSAAPVVVATAIAATNRSFQSRITNIGNAYGGFLANFGSKAVTFPLAPQQATIIKIPDFVGDVPVSFGITGVNGGSSTGVTVEVDDGWWSYSILPYPGISP